jgi:heme oxygenase
MLTDHPVAPAPVRTARAPILTRLRADTADHHASLEAHLPLHASNLSRATYHALLLRFWGFYAPLEERLLAGPLQPQPAFDYRARRKTPKLQQDLHALGDTPEQLSRTPQCTELPRLSTLPQVLGCLYVVEGASLGGQLIARQVQASLGLGHDTGAQFFGGYGVDTGRHWRATGALLTDMALALDQDDAIVASANDTFLSLGRWMAAAALPH